jgi:hypothetical protein
MALAWAGDRLQVLLALIRDRGLADVEEHLGPAGGHQVADIVEPLFLFGDRLLVRRDIALGLGDPGRDLLGGLQVGLLEGDRFSDQALVGRHAPELDGQAPDQIFGRTGLALQNARAGDGRDLRVGREADVLILGAHPDDKGVVGVRNDHALVDLSVLGESDAGGRHQHRPQQRHHRFADIHRARLHRPRSGPAMRAARATQGSSVVNSGRRARHPLDT